jgi:hypothetical protein
MASKGYCNRGQMGVQTGDDIKDTIICSYSQNVFLPSNSGKVNPLIRNLFQLFLLFIYCLWFRLKQWREAYKIKKWYWNKLTGLNEVWSLLMLLFLCGLGLVWSRSSTIWVHFCVQSIFGDTNPWFKILLCTMVFCSFCLGPVCVSVILLHLFSVTIEANK